MPIEVKLDRARLMARMKNGKQFSGAAVAAQILDDCREFTPHDRGDLEDSARIEQNGDEFSVVWSTAYAAYQYYGCWPDGSHVIRQHDTKTNALATTQWAEAARDRYGKNWKIVAQRAHVRGGGR